MKKVVLVIAFISVMFAAVAQEGLNLGLHYAVNSTWLMNKQVFDEGPEMDVAPSIGGYFGVIAGYYFSDNFGLELNINSNTMSQGYLGAVDNFFNNDVNIYTSSTIMKTMDIPVLMKFGKSTYFEIGPLVQFVNKATYTRTFMETNILSPGLYNNMAYSFSNVSGIGVKSDFKGIGFGASFGFGANINLIEDVLRLNFGARFNYIITDMEGINGLGLTKDSNFVPDSEKENFHTNPLYGGLKVGLIYYFD